MSSLQECAMDENNVVTTTKMVKSRRPLATREQNILSVRPILASKPKMAAMKPPRSEQPKLISLGSSSENIQEWPSLIEEKRSDDSKASSDTSELDREDRPSIFRQMADFDDQDDMLVLKRANPVYDSDDEDYFEAPSKRQRTSSSGSTAIQWGARLSEDPTEGFCIRLQH